MDPLCPPFIILASPEVDQTLRRTRLSFLPITAGVTALFTKSLQHDPGNLFQICPNPPLAFQDSLKKQSVENPDKENLPPPFKSCLDRADSALLPAPVMRRSPFPEEAVEIETLQRSCHSQNVVLVWRRINFSKISCVRSLESCSRTILFSWSSESV